jgi:hypothetical protein
MLMKGRERGGCILAANPRPGSNNSPVYSVCVCVCMLSFTYVFREEEMTEGDLGKKHNRSQSTFIYMHLGWCVYAEFTEVF